MPSSFSILSRRDSQNTMISNYDDPKRTYRVNSINLRSRSHSRQRAPKITNIQLVKSKKKKEMIDKFRKENIKKTINSKTVFFIDIFKF